MLHLFAMEATSWFALALCFFVLASSVVLVLSNSSAQDTPDAKEKKNKDESKDKEETGDMTEVPNQCGLNDDGIAWARKVPPTRKIECEEPPEKQAKYRSILRTIFSVASLLGQRVDFDPNDVVEIALAATKYFASEPSFIEYLQPPLTVIGDLHGQLHDLNRIFTVHEVDGKPGYECSKFLFLGDYVDRGRQSLEVVMALFILKILYPAKYFLLRGNHEFLSTNLTQGFGAECLARFGLGSAKMVFALVNSTFCWLSLCTLIGGKVFAVHAGISTTGFNLRGLRNMRKPIIETKEGYLMHDLVWSDPAEGLTGTCHNANRLSSIYFGEDAFAHAMHKIGASYLIRAHSVIMEGAMCTWNRIYTIFSCTDMSKGGNLASFAKLATDLSLEVYVFSIDKNRKRLEAAMYGDKDEDETTIDSDKDCAGIPQISKF